MPSIVSAARLAIVLAWLSLPAQLLGQSSAVPTSGILGFLERCSQRPIVCFSEKELSAGRSGQISAILVRAGGLHRQCNGSVYKCALYMKPSSGVEECTPSYYLNGVAFFRAFPDEALPELDKFVRPVDVRGIEVYRSEQRPPAPFNSPTSCGVILIWTKQ